jgi:alkylation response protein AidB-like acyl-CoA dehydrogenase
MNFQLSEDHLAIRDAAREFAEHEIAPSAVERDKTGEFPTDIVQKLGELGFMGMMTAPEWGGAGLDAVSYVLALEEIAKVDASVAVIMSVNNSLVCWVIETFGTDEQKERFLRPLATGQKLGAYCLSEPGIGSDATQQATTGRLQSDGSYLLNGAKNWITNGTTADHYIVFAQTDPAKKHHGITCFILDKGMPGFEIGLKEDKLGIRSSDTCSLGFTDVRLEADRVIGTDGQGFKIAMETLNGGRIGIAAQALGIASGAMERSIRYTFERRAFGKPINQLQAIQFKLADMQVKVEAARMLILRAARTKDTGQNYIKEAAMAKLYASSIAMEVATQAIQVHGGYGYVREYLVERALRDAKITEIYEGTSEIQHIVIARQLMKEYEIRS